MKRISVIIVAGLSLALLVYAHPQTPLSKSQTPASKAQSASSPSVRVVKVNAQTLVGLPADKNYIADLSRGGVIYEFNPTRGSIDLQRVGVRTTTGVQAIKPLLEKTFSKSALTGLQSKGFRIGAAADIRQLPPINQKPPSTTSPIISCGAESCTCENQLECGLLLSLAKCGMTVCTLDYSWCECTFKSPLE